MLSDNESMYTALETAMRTEQLGLTPTTTAYSPGRTGLSEAVVHTLRRDYADGTDLSSARRIFTQRSGWIADYNTQVPNSALGDRPPVEYRQAMETV